MRILVPACILFMVLAAGLYPDKKSPGFFLNVAACLLMIVALLITLLVGVSIDNEIKTWTAETAPSHWDAAGQGWQYFRTARTCDSLASLGSLALAIVLANS